MGIEEKRGGGKRGREGMRGEEIEKGAKNMSVLIAKMFSGSYGNSNLCHEVINLFTADDGRNYIYIPKYGKYTNGAMDGVTHVILITENGKTSDGKKQFDCIGMVEIDRSYPYNEWFIKNCNTDTSNFTPKFVSDNSTITYGGRRLFYSCELESFGVVV